MTAPAAPKVDCEQQHPSLAVPDIPAAAEFYRTKLGFFVAFTWGDPPTMAGVTLGHVQKHGIDYDSHASYRFVEE
jgi:catechol 2,3-dioxygenase-like lactoylglutathione lyase family enzyme